MINGHAHADEPRPNDEPTRRALAFLNREVPRWQRENHCFSCHNNGDGARALLMSANTRFAFNGTALDDTIAFLSRPESWDKNGVDAAFSDKRLARLQFATALAAVDKAGRLPDRRPLIKSADSLAKDQADDGAWPIDDAAPVGSPTTYGPRLATALAIEVLRRADPQRFRQPIHRAESFLQNAPIRNVLEACATLLALSLEGKANRRPITNAIDHLRRAQNDDGSWGPFPRSASEPFDTAIALLGLATAKSYPEIRATITKGREALIAMQKADGSWTETTRPPGAESYAQRISTTAWATMALLATEPAPPKAAAPPKS